MGSWDRMNPRWVIFWGLVIGAFGAVLLGLSLADIGKGGPFVGILPLAVGLFIALRGVTRLSKEED